MHMDNQIVETGGGGVLTLLGQGGGLGDVIKPLTKEIFLYDTYIAGTSHLEDEQPLFDIKVDDQLILQREDNRYDDKAILVLDDQMRKLGYVPERHNTIFSRLMDAGKCLVAKVTKMEEEGWFKRISIRIFMVDF